MPSQFKFLPLFVFCFFANATNVGVFQQEQLKRSPLAMVRRANSIDRKYVGPLNKPAYIWHLIDELYEGDGNQALVDIVEMLSISLAAPHLRINAKNRGDIPSKYVTGVFTDKPRSNPKFTAHNDNPGPVLYYRVTALRDLDLVNAFLQLLNPEYPRVRDALCLISPSDQDQRFKLGQYLLKIQTNFDIYDLKPEVKRRLENPPPSLADQLIEECSKKFLNTEKQLNKPSVISQYLRDILGPELKLELSTASKIEQLTNLVRVADKTLVSVDSSFLRGLVSVLYFTPIKRASLKVKIALQVLRKEVGILLLKVEPTYPNFKYFLTTTKDIFSNVDDSVLDFRQILLNHIIARNKEVHPLVLANLNLNNFDPAALASLDLVKGLKLDMYKRKKILDNVQLLSTSTIFAPNLSLQLYTKENLDKKLSQALRLNRQRLNAIRDNKGERRSLDYEDEKNFEDLVNQQLEPGTKEDFALFAHLLSYAQDYRIYDQKLLELGFRLLQTQPQDELFEMHEQVLVQVIKYMNWYYQKKPLRAVDAQRLVNSGQPNFEYRFYLSRSLVKNNEFLQAEYIKLLDDSDYVLRAYQGLVSAKILNSKTDELFENWKKKDKQVFAKEKITPAVYLALFEDPDSCSNLLGQIR